MKGREYMNLISCDYCGVVLDKDNLNFPNIQWEDDQDELDATKYAWHNDEWMGYRRRAARSDEFRRQYARVLHDKG